MTLTLVPYAFRAPAQAIGRHVYDLGWRTTDGWVTPGHLAMVDAWRKEIVLPEDFAQRLVCPELEQEVLAWVLAHELAHVVLHQPQIIRGERTERMERAAAGWALEFLLPQGALADHPETRALMSTALHTQRYAKMAAIARDFCVPVACAEQALRRYQIIPDEGVWQTVKEAMAA